MAELSPGLNLAHYRIVSKIGAGGMGEVYLAQDTSELGRTVALKILPAEIAKDRDRLQRFTQEARTVSNLNHPNILTVHEFGQTDSACFIATEYIDGVTLREHLSGRRLKLIDVLDVVIQVVAALNAAHEAGVTHRDLKPENVMVRKDNIVKVLDFGLAKPSGPAAGSGGSAGAETNEDAATKVLVRTEPGLVMGTVSYMSPEQSAGTVVDQRTDIWSVGVVLYEMIAGCVPFTGKDIHRQIIAIQEVEPVPLFQRVEGLPERLEEIVAKCLTKDKDERYQTAKDLLIDLRNLRRKLDVDAEIDRTVAPQLRTTSGGTPRASTQGTQTDAGATSAAEAHATSSAEYLVTGIKQHKLATGLVALVLIAGTVGLGLYLRAGKDEVLIKSIAVMPFVNESGNADAEYLSDGMTETLISSLSQLPNLNVKPRSSVFRYKGKETNPQTIAKELNVQAILNGRVVQRGQDVSLYVELIDVALEKVVWSQQYNRKQSDLVTLQTDIARDVSSRLKTKLSGADEAKVTKTYTKNPEAYQLYLKGKYFYAKYNESSYQKAIDYYKQAIEIDPNYALAYHGIAEAYNTANDWYLPPNEAQPKAKAAVLKALELDNTLAQAHYTLGGIAFWYDWDWRTAEREWQRAGELDSSYSTYPLYLAAMGRHDEAIKTQEMRQRSLPLDLQMSMDLEGVYLYAGRYDQVIDQARKTMELDQNYWAAHQDVGLAYERKKQYPEAIAALEKARSLDNNPSVLGYLGFVYAAAGKRAEAQRVLEELKALSKQRHVPPYSIAIIYAGLNDKDQAFAWLNKAYDDRSFFIALLKVETTLDNLRPDPRFKEMLKRLNLPE